MRNVTKFYILWFSILVIFAMPYLFKRMNQREYIEAKVNATFDYLNKVPNDIAISSKVINSHLKFPSSISKNAIVIALKKNRTILLIEVNNSSFLVFGPVQDFVKHNEITWECFSSRHFQDDEILRNFKLVEIGLLPAECR